MRLLRTGLLTGLLLGMMTVVEPGQAGVAIGLPAQEWTQLLNHAQLLGMSQKQIEMAVTALKSYQELSRAGTLLSHQQWSNVSSDLLNIAQIAQVGQGIAFSMSSLDAQFRQSYPGFNVPSAPYFQQYQKWSQVTLDTIRGTMKSNGMIWQNLRNEDQLRTYLQQQSQSAVGQTQAIQVGAQVGIEEIGQLQKLRELMLSDMQSKQAYQAYQVQKDMQQQSFDHNFFAPGKAGRDGKSF